MQSSPMRAAAPTTTFGWMTVRAPTDAPAPIVTNGPMATSAPRTASDATALNGSMPAGDAVAADNKATARAKLEYGSSLRRTAHAAGGRAVSVDPRMTADAFVVASADRYRGLVRNVRSPRRAC